MQRKGWNAFKSYKKRKPSTRHSNGRNRGLRVNAPEFIPSWLRKTVKSSAKIVSNGFNSLLREINTKRRRSLGETRRRSR